MDIQAKNKKLSSLILQTGGVTFLGYLTIGIVGLVVPLLQLKWSIFYMMKLFCLFTHIAWYWISANDEMNAAVSRMFINVF